MLCLCGGANNVVYNSNLASISSHPIRHRNHTHLVLLYNYREKREKSLELNDRMRRKKNKEKQRDGEIKEDKINKGGNGVIFFSIK